jgi:hypothetical protein
MRIAVNGSWRNAGDVSADVSVLSVTDPIPQFTQQGQIVTAQHIVVPFTIPAGTSLATFRLAWRADWGNYPPADLDVLLVSPRESLIWTVRQKTVPSMCPSSSRKLETGSRSTDLTSPQAATNTNSGSNWTGKSSTSRP